MLTNLYFTFPKMSNICSSVRSYSIHAIKYSDGSRSTILLLNYLHPQERKDLEQTLLVIRGNCNHVLVDAWYPSDTEYAFVDGDKKDVTANSVNQVAISFCQEFGKEIMEELIDALSNQ